MKARQACFRQRLHYSGLKFTSLEVLPRRQRRLNRGQKWARDNFVVQGAGLTLLVGKATVMLLSSCCRSNLVPRYEIIENSAVKEVLSDEYFYCRACLAVTPHNARLHPRPPYAYFTFTDFAERVRAVQPEPLEAFLAAREAWSELEELVARMYGKKFAEES